MTIKPNKIHIQTEYHHCSLLDEAEHQIYNKEFDTRWWFDCNRYTLVRIYHCPYCGIKLERRDG